MRILIFVLASLAGAPVLANDTSAAFGAGGLIFTRSDHIVMVSEDLHLSPYEVRVRYAFRNDSDEDVTTTVAFPLPAIPLGVGAPPVNLPNVENENLVDFSVTVDRQPVEASINQRAIDDQGTDVTEAITATGLPVSPFRPEWQEKARTLPEQAKEQLADRGLVELIDTDVDGKDVLLPDPTWHLRLTFHWEQTFPAGKTVVVEHRYEPIAGLAPIVDAAELDGFGEYCLDEEGREAVDRMLAEQEAAQQKEDYSRMLYARSVDYILTTGANWKGPIGDFRLTIDKGAPQAILSTCTAGIRKVGPTSFAVTHTDFTPDKDIRFVIFDFIGNE